MEQHVYSGTRFDFINYFTLFFVLCSNVPKYIKNLIKVKIEREEIETKSRVNGDFFRPFLEHRNKTLKSKTYRTSIWNIRNKVELVFKNKHLAIEQNPQQKERDREDDRVFKHVRLRDEPQCPVHSSSVRCATCDVFSLWSAITSPKRLIVLTTSGTRARRVVLRSSQRSLQPWSRRAV